MSDVMRQISVRIPEELAQEVEAHEGTTSQVVRDALEEYFDREEDMNRRVAKIEAFLHANTTGVGWPE